LDCNPSIHIQGPILVIVVVQKTAGTPVRALDGPQPKISPSGDKNGAKIGISAEEL
jgi:hypothetical protein